MPNNYLTQHFFGAIGAKLFIGTVESRADPLQMGRARLRIHGYHVPDTGLIPTEELPWAFPVMPLDSPGVSGVGSTTCVMNGSTVLGFWADWPDCQVPMMLGTLNQTEYFSGISGSDSLHGPGNTINDSTGPGGPGTINPTGDGPRWLQIARGEMGTDEWPGSSHNPQVLKYGKDLGFTTDDSQHPWCAAFTRWCLKEAGCDVSGMNGMAKSAMSAPSMERLSEPIYGCVAVKSRSAASRNSSSGHTGFWVGRAGGKDKYLGGNQGNSVNISTFSLAAHEGYYWPKGQPKNFGTSGSPSVSNDATVDNASQG